MHKTLSCAQRPRQTGRDRDSGRGRSACVSKKLKVCVILHLWYPCIITGPLTTDEALFPFHLNMSICSTKDHLLLSPAELGKKNQFPGCSLHEFMKPLQRRALFTALPHFNAVAHFPMGDITKRGGGKKQGGREGGRHICSCKCERLIMCHGRETKEKSIEIEKERDTERVARRAEEVVEVEIRACGTQRNSDNSEGGTGRREGEDGEDCQSKPVVGLKIVLMIYV